MFWNCRLPDSQGPCSGGSVSRTAMASGLQGVGTGDHRLVCYRVPVEWGTLTEGSLVGFKQSSRATFW
jgi:hypothetical protein